MYHRGDDDQKQLLIKKCTTRLTGICLTIGNRRDLLVHNAVLNFVPNNGTRILPLLRLVVWFCLFDRFVFFLLYNTLTETLPLINTYPPMHITTELHTSILIYTCVATLNVKTTLNVKKFTLRVNFYAKSRFFCI